MATVISTQPTSSSIINLENCLLQNLMSINPECDLNKSSGNVEEVTEPPTAGVVSEETVALKDLASEQEMRQLREESEKSGTQEQRKFYNQCCCYVYDDDKRGGWYSILNCFSSCFRFIVYCYDCSCYCCGICKCRCYTVHSNGCECCGWDCCGGDWQQT